VVVDGAIDRERVRESTGHTNKAEAQSWATRREFELDREAIYGPEAIFTFGAALAMYLDGGGEQRFLLPLLNAWDRKLMKDIHPGDVVDLANQLYPKRAGRRRTGRSSRQCSPSSGTQPSGASAHQSSWSGSRQSAS
jgi:hypothetical protein